MEKEFYNDAPPSSLGSAVDQPEDRCPAEQPPDISGGPSAPFLILSQRVKIARTNKHRRAVNSVRVQNTSAAERLRGEPKHAERAFEFKALVNNN